MSKKPTFMTATRIDVGGALLALAYVLTLGLLGYMVVDDLNHTAGAAGVVPSSVARVV
ncbi:hypothetical protein ACFYVL_14120 [Streptomyces sp. NPDC004111]|uniref:hypothetical protein n=1 Tax=Streptomyces sp. NPDC004111 TaxID=3364690 RepID=UPI003680836E